MLVDHARTTGGRRRAPRRTGRILALAALLSLVASAATAATLVLRDRPDPQEAAAVDRAIGAASPAAAAHLDGWRPELHAEAVTCALPDGIVETTASELALTARLTRAAIVRECVSGNDLARLSAAPLRASAAVVCVRDAAHVPQPVVLLDGSSCARPPAALDADRACFAPAGAPVLDGAGWCERGLPLRPLAAPDLATLNRLRAVEVSLLAVPADDRCPSLAAATRWAVEQVRASGLPLRVVADDRSGGVDGACFLPSTYWPDGVVLVDVSSLPADA